MVQAGTSLGGACEDIPKGNFTQGGVRENIGGPESAPAEQWEHKGKKREESSLIF